MRPDTTQGLAVVRGLEGAAGFRNLLVHDYLGVDLEHVYRAVEQDVPKLKLACEAALRALEHPE